MKDTAGYLLESYLQGSSSSNHTRRSLRLTLFLQPTMIFAGLTFTIGAALLACANSLAVSLCKTTIVAYCCKCCLVSAVRPYRLGGMERSVCTALYGLFDFPYADALLWACHSRLWHWRWDHVRSIFASRNSVSVRLIISNTRINCHHSLASSKVSSYKCLSA